MIRTKCMMLLLVIPSFLFGINTFDNTQLSNHHNASTTIYSDTIWLKSQLENSENLSSVEIFEIASRLDTLATASGNNKLKIYSLKILSEEAQHLGKFDLSRRYYHKLIELTIPNEKNTNTALAKIYNGLGTLSLWQGLKDSAEYYYDLALEKYQIIEDKSEIVGILINHGVLYQTDGKLRDALKYFEQALSIYQTQNNHGGIACCYSNIGLNYKLRKNYESYLRYLEMAISEYELAGNRQKKARMYMQVGQLYALQNQDDLASDYYRQAKDIFEQLDAKLYLVDVNVSLWKIRSKTDIETAKTYLDKANDIVKELNSTTYSCLIYTEKGAYYLKIKQADSAITHLQQAINLAHASGHDLLLPEAYKYLYQSYSLAGDYKKAFIFKEKYHILHDSIYNEEYLNEITQLNAEMQFREKEQLLEIEHQKSSIHKLILIIISLSIGLISIVLYIFLRKKFNKTLIQNKKLNCEVEHKNRELTQKVLVLNQQNNLIRSTTNTLKQNQVEFNDQVINNIINDLAQDANQNLWKEFELRFKEVQPSFYESLLHRYQDLTQNEIRLCAFLRLGLNSKEISSITGQSASAIEKARTRLRKKMGLSGAKKNLTIHIQEI